MKKAVLGICLLFIVLSCVSCMTTANGANVTAADFQIGMTYDEVFSIIRDEPHGSLEGYLFFRELTGKNIVLDLQSPDYTQLNQILIFEPVMPTEAAMKQVHEGMTFCEVVELLGFPEEPYALSGMIASKYTLENGKSVLIYWSSRRFQTPAEPATVTSIKWLNS